MASKEIVCEHCGGTITGRIYKVMSEEEGVVMLDMTVCEACSVEARKLDLKTEEQDPSNRERLKHS